MEVDYVMIFSALVSCLQPPAVLTCLGTLHGNGCRVIPVGRIASAKGQFFITNGMNTASVVFFREPTHVRKQSSRFRFGSAGVIRYWRKSRQCINEVPTVCLSLEDNFCQDSQLLCKLYDVNECIDDSNCQNNGTCHYSDGLYHCICKTGWQGRNCTEDINECENNPCRNSGTCLNNEGGYSCDCTSQWHGRNCDMDVNECEDDNPCQNEGICQNVHGGYTCSCATGWQGTNCSKDVNECDDNPCQNDGTCLNIEGSYNCTCQPQWQGKDCETDVNECDANPCRNDGTCLNIEGSYNCTCKPQWQGKNCETDVNECDDNPCRNDGTCLNIEGSYNCTCKPQWQGNNCETVLGPPQNVTVTHRSRTDLLIEWYPPVILKGNVIKYEIQYQAKERPYLSFYNEDENETTFELNDDTKFGKVAVNITSLDPSTVYEIQMSAFTTVGQGKEVAKTVATLVETNLTPLRKKDVQVSASEQNFEIRLPVLRQKYATHYVVSIVELSERKYGIMTAEFNKTDNVTVFHLNVDNTYTSFKGIVWGVAVYQIYIGTQSRVRENKHIVWSDGITLKVPPWFNLIRVFVATILTVIFITGVTILCRLQSYCRNEQYHRNEEKDLKRLKSPNRCCEVDQSDAEVFNVNTNLEERYAKFHGGDLETKESSKDELKKNLAVERTDEEEKLAKGEGDIVYRKALVEVVVEKGSSDEDFREETSTMIYASENCRNNEHNLASEVIPQKVHPINGKGKLDLIDQIVLEPSDAIYSELSEKEGFIKVDAVSDDAHDEDGVKPAKQNCRGSKTKDVCDQQELGKSNPLLEGTTKCDLKETEAQYLKEDNSMRMRETKARTASDSDDDVYDDFDDVNPMLNESDSNGNKKPGLLKAMLKLLKGDYNAIKKQAEMGVLEVNYQGNDQTEEHDICNAAIKTDEQLDVLKKGCPREDEGLQHDAFAESISNCRFQKVKSDLNLEPDFPLEISKDIKREDKLSFYTENKVHHSEENELRCIKNVVTENERPIESNVSETTTVPDIHDVTPANIKGSRVSSMTVNNGWIDENGDRKRNAADHVSHFVDISDNDTANEKCGSKFKSENQDSESKNSVGLELYDNTRDKVYLDIGHTKGKVGVVDCFEEVYDDTEVEEKQIPVTTHCAHDVYPNPFTDNDFEMTDKSLADSFIDVYDETSVEEGCRLNTANKEIDAFNVPSSQEIYDESCVDSDQEYINSDHRKLPARPKMSSNSQTKHIPDNVIDFYTKPDVNGATERTSEIYEMIPAEENPCKGRQTSIFYTFRNKILFKPRNRGSKNASFRKLPPTPSENRLSVNPFWGDIPSYSTERSVETNIDDDIYEELSEDDETAKYITEDCQDGCKEAKED